MPRPAGFEKKKGVLFLSTNEQLDHVYGFFLFFLFNQSKTYKDGMGWIIVGSSSEPDDALDALSVCNLKKRIVLQRA